jgi:ubiquinone/menaquinone biosynthesis C-methylase UbiE
MLLKAFKKNIFSYLDQNYQNWDITIAMRYQPVVDLIRLKYTPADKLLEIGPGELGILPYIDSSYSITGLDIDFGASSQKNRMHMVKQKNKHFPFTNNSYDFVYSLDTLEHVPPENRETTIFEAIRVAKKSVLIGFPSGLAAKLSDLFLDKYYTFTHRSQFPYLHEHLEYGLPVTSEVVSQIKASAKKLNKKVDVYTESNTNAFLWVLLLSLGFSQQKPLTFLYKLCILLLPIFQHFNFWPSYRTMVYVEIKPS